MAIMDIITENKDISWVIRKNPETQKENNKPFQRDLRKGEILSWYVNENHFRTYFKEKNLESSFYKNLNNNYLNQSAYNCPYVYCSIINENFSSVLKKETEKDLVCFNEIILHQVFISNAKIIKLFQKHFENISIEENKIEHKVSQLKVSGKTTLNYLIKVVHVLCLILAIEDKNLYIEVNESIAKKYAQYLIDINAPYFIVYLYNSRLINDFNMFKTIKEMFKEKQWELFYGNTQKQRYDQIKKVMPGGKLLNDIGCGELYYSKYFKDIYDQIFAWDTDKTIQERNSKYLNKKSISNIILKDEFKVEEMQSDNETDLLITEMLEHVPKEKAIEFLQNIKEKQFRKLVITLPNQDFNKFYKLEDEFRHDDHYWEPTYEESVDMIKSIFNDKLKEIKKIGDKIDNISVSTLFVIEN
jgi:hypothetical protein